MGIVLADQDTVAYFEGLAEAAYAAMYEERPYRVKDCYEDARLNFGKAIEAARRAGLTDEIARLTKREEHVVKVYNSQFRWL